MDEILITVGFILSIIAFIELISYFVAPRYDSAQSYIAVLPVFEDDEKFRERIDNLTNKGYGRRIVLLVNYSASHEQSLYCKQFVETSPDSVYISSHQLEEYFKEIFH